MNVKLMKGLQECIRGHECQKCPYFLTNDCRATLLADAEELLKEDVTPAGRAGQCPAPTDEAFGRWISVNDRLPEQHEEDPEDPQDPDARYTVSDPVLVYDGKHITAGVFCEGIWDLDATYTDPGTVTHWMPLPEPPKEET